MSVLASGLRDHLALDVPKTFFRTVREKIPDGVARALLDEHVSLSVVIALGWCGIIAVVLGLLAPAEIKNAVFALSGNFVFFGFLWGWLFGSIRKRVFEH